MDESQKYFHMSGTAAFVSYTLSTLLDLLDRYEERAAKRQQEQMIQLAKALGLNPPPASAP